MKEYTTPFYFLVEPILNYVFIHHNSEIFLIGASLPNIQSRIYKWVISYKLFLIDLIHYH